MGCQLASFEHLLVVRWGLPEIRDCAIIDEKVKRLRETSGREVVYIAVIPEDLNNFDEDQRARFERLSEGLMPLLDRMVIVIQATGFRGAVMRSMTTALILVARRANTLKVVSSLDAALDEVLDRLPSDHVAVADAFREAGVDVPAKLPAA
ncbi:hypothetical protein G6O69_19925 [Pseudenhygromyxa sp. WMMC2535]|uniref:hypothetical protein n=1 Tax=Pseudenhygromyxa sp. WMMC2535 TaxID=2712867 RepID=UPI001552B081|nr:hypothetical protein [Pseudenhygromyxa sp. WMMC2535]NVB40125.1 hypothetical protein [Pseudenhygromyxa sp. WMMC2535]